MTDTELSVLVETAYLSRYAEVVENCRKAGLRVQRQMTAIGVITGTIETSRMGELYRVAGVRKIEPSHVNRCMNNGEPAR